VKQQTPSEDLSSLIDEYGDLQAELAAMKPKQARAAILKQELAARFAWAAESQDYIEHGKRYDLVVSACANERDFKPDAMRKLARFLGKLFWPLCKISLEDFDDHIALPLRKQYVTESQTGARRMKAILKAQVKAA
jgi:hypothetical protein